MTVKELIIELESLGEKHYNKEVFLINNCKFYSPHIVELTEESKWGPLMKDKVLID